jgi:hypothetical protein
MSKIADARNRVAEARARMKEREDAAAQLVADEAAIAAADAEAEEKARLKALSEAEKGLAKVADAYVEKRDEALSKMLELRDVAIEARNAAGAVNAARSEVARLRGVDAGAVAAPHPPAVAINAPGSEARVAFEFVQSFLLDLNR